MLGIEGQVVVDHVQQGRSIDHIARHGLSVEVPFTLTSGCQHGSVARPAYVTIATAGFPERFVEPVTGQLAADGTLRGQSVPVARRAVEGLIYLCWLRSGIAGLAPGRVRAGPAPSA